MTCDVTAFPIPSVIWRKNGRRFYGDSSRVGVSESMVRFNKLLPADTGTYECYAENSSGSDQKSMSLNVEPGNHYIFECLHCSDVDSYVDSG